VNAGVVYLVGAAVPNRSAQLTITRRHGEISGWGRPRMHRATHRTAPGEKKEEERVEEGAPQAITRRMGTRDKGAAQSLPSEEEGRQLSFFPSEPLAF
jgi:hypothetical protein